MSCPLSLGALKLIRSALAQHLHERRHSIARRMLTAGHTNCTGAAYGKSR